jgi:hypothetical protein
MSSFDVVKPEADASFLVQVRWELMEEIRRRHPNLLLEVYETGGLPGLIVRKTSNLGWRWVAYLIVTETVVEVNIDDDANIYSHFDLAAPGSVEAAIDYLLDHA